MTEDCRRYGRLSDHLYRFIAALASRQKPDWGEREDIEMALQFIRRLERMHEIEEQTERSLQEYERNERRQERLKKKKANIVKLVADDNANRRAPYARFRQKITEGRPIPAVTQSPQNPHIQHAPNP